MPAATLLDKKTMSLDVLKATELARRALFLSPISEEAQFIAGRIFTLSPTAGEAQFIAKKVITLSPTAPGEVELLESRILVIVPLGYVPPDGEPEPEGINWWLWGGLAAVAIIVAIVIARRK